MLLSDIPMLAARHAPDVEAIRFGERALTYVELRDRCWRLSNALSRAASPGDRVAILAENCPEYAECYYGVPGAGLPKGVSGKVLKRELRDRIAAGELALVDP